MEHGMKPATVEKRCFKEYKMWNDTPPQGVTPHKDTSDALTVWDYTFTASDVLLLKLKKFRILFLQVVDSTVKLGLTTTRSKPPRSYF